MFVSPLASLHFLYPQYQILNFAFRVFPLSALALESGAGEWVGCSARWVLPFRCSAVARSAPAQKVIKILHYRLYHS